MQLLTVASTWGSPACVRSGPTPMPQSAACFDLQSPKIQSVLQRRSGEGKNMRMRQVIGAGVVCLIGVLYAGSDTATAATLKVCAPKREGSAVVTPTHGNCKKGYALTTLGAEAREGKRGESGAEGKPGPEGKGGPEGKAGTEGNTGPEGKAGPEGVTELSSDELATLKEILPYIKYVASGVAGKPTIQFSAVNVQVLSGAGSTKAAVNGEGNLVVGYDEDAGAPANWL